MSFFPIHVHSMYSINQALSKPKDIIDRCVELGYSACALTDINSLSGVVDFMETAEEKGVRAIVGCEITTAFGNLVLLAKNKAGYIGLCKIVTKAWENEEHVSEFETIRPHISNLICIDGFSGSVLHKKLETGDYAQYMKNMKAWFPDNYYISLEPVEDSALADKTRELPGRKIAQCHSFYVKPELAQDHHILVCCSENTTLKKRGKQFPPNESLQLPSLEYLRKFHTEEELNSNEEILNKIEPFTLLGNPITPKFECPDGKTEKEYLTELCREGWKRKMANLPKEQHGIYAARFKEELDTFTEAGLEGYFLIVADYVNWAKRNGYLIAPSRGCLVNTNILTDKGYKDISEIELGDIVYSESGKRNIVKNKFKYQNTDKIIKLNTSFGDFQGINLTEEHKVLAVKRTKHPCGSFRPLKEINVEWIEATKLEIGDYICFPKIEHQGREISFDLSEFLYSKKNGSKAFIDGDSISVYKTGNHISSSQYLKTPKKITLDEEFAYVLGVFTGDGWVNSPKGRRSITSFCFHSVDNQESQVKVEKFMTEKLGCLATYVNNQNGKQVNQVHFTNELVNKFFRSLFPDYKYEPSSKSVPLCIFEAEKNIILSYIKGLMDSDGHVSKQKTKIESISKKLIYQVKHLFSILHIPCAVRRQVRQDTRKDFLNTKPSYCAETRNFFSNDKLKNNFLEDSEFFYFRIIKKEELEPEPFVYDFEVENEHNYLTTSGIVHNSSAGCLISYLLNITEVDPIPYGLLLERFFNKGRAESGSLPDIDTDFPEQAKEPVREYLIQKYGPKRAVKICTFMTMKGAAAISNVIRVTEACEYSIAKQISKSLPNAKEMVGIGDLMKEEKEVSLLRWVLKHQPERISEWCRLGEDGELYGEYSEQFKQAIRLEGTVVGIGQHAAGVIITSEDIDNFCPILRANDGSLITAFEMGAAEKARLVKFDLLTTSVLDKLMMFNEIISEL